MRSVPAPPCFVPLPGHLVRAPCSIIFYLDDKSVAARPSADKVDKTRLVDRMGVFARIDEPLTCNRAYDYSLFGRNQSFWIERKENRHAFGARKRTARRVSNFTQIYANFHASDAGRTRQQAIESIRNDNRCNERLIDRKSGVFSRSRENNSERTYSAMMVRLFAIR
jgi:hypothetical protein